MPRSGRSRDASDRIYRWVSRIPEGTVATYGQIARLADVGPRQVGRALATLPAGNRCPWHRVINAQGRVSERSANAGARSDQERRLEAEGVEFHNGRIDLEVYRWEPEG
ncbi:MAG: MGMT family protein [Candidatus Latescibacteria bacterium]|nr:MGMT family protein [Candidatus Latescibacterota bacterium]